MTVSHDPDTPVPPEQPAASAASGGGGARLEHGWRWWFAAAGPWVGVAVALAAIVMGR
jgi:hypothetical protein